MIFHIGPPPNSLNDAELASGEWLRVPRLSVWALHLVALPVGVAMAALFFIAWAVIAPRYNVEFQPLPHVIGAFSLVVIAGAFVQAFAYPGYGFTKETIIGLWPSRFTPYTAHSTTVNRCHVISASVLPFLTLAVFPLLFASVFRISSGWLVFVSCSAAATFGTNVLHALPIYRLPSTGVFAGRGFQVYWRLPQ